MKVVLLNKDGKRDDNFTIRAIADLLKQKRHDAQMVEKFIGLRHLVETADEEIFVVLDAIHNKTETDRIAEYVAEYAEKFEMKAKVFILSNPKDVREEKHVFRINKYSNSIKGIVNRIISE
jgi:hypothetical protein